MLTTRCISDSKPKPMIFSKAQDNVLMKKLLNQVCELVDSYTGDNGKSENAAIAEYYNNLCNDYEYVEQSLRAYSAIAGGTNQQSEKILTMKTERQYENVVIDEAARSNPLDLLIPMSFAKERIILVGDHRQLPHIIDDRIVKRIVEEETGDVVKYEKELMEQEIREVLQKSLFERLKDTLVELEKKDGIRRYITLDQQFRMHPFLGEFVSRQFYETHDSRERFESPRGAEQFMHSLPGLENKAAVWLDVPVGSEERHGSSMRRVSEARALVRHLKSMMDSDAGRQMTFGIITFYASQRDFILEVMAECGMAERRGEEILIKEAYHTAVIEKEGQTQLLERLRIGSVDAFQGMEFDAVYLSVVRSNKDRKYGFLEMENRLCVAMSRQKRILIAVGDSAMFTCDAARKSVPSLSAFYELCKEEKYGKIISDRTRVG